MVQYLTRYIAKAVVSNILLVMVVLIGLQSFLSLIGELGSLGTGHYSVVYAMAVVGFHMPGYAYQLFPMAGLVGSMIGLGRLAATGELVVMQVSGYSTAKVARSVLFGAVSLMLVMLALGEWVAPDFNQKADDLKNRLQGKLVHKKPSMLWLKQGSDYLYLKRMDSSRLASNATYFSYAPNGDLKSIAYARHLYKQAPHRWLWVKADQTRFTSGAVPQKVLQSSLEVPMHINTQLAVKGQKKSAFLTLPQMYLQIQSAGKVGLAETTLRFNFWHRLLQPITSVIMICLGVPFIFGALREVGAGARVMTGVGVGFLFYVLNQVLGPLALVLQIVPFIAALIPIFLFLAVYFVMPRGAR